MNIPLKYYYRAYRIARKGKMSTRAEIKFESNLDANIRALKYAIDSRCWRLGVSTCFVVLKPRPREIFAGDFEKRLAETLLMFFLRPLIEGELIDRTYNCRQGKGMYNCIRTLREDMSSSPSEWVFSGDIRSFFMSLKNEMIKDRLISLIKGKYTGKYLGDLIYITSSILDYKPQDCCVILSKPEMWKNIPSPKSLFRNGDDKNMPIGDLLSQWSALYILNDFGHTLLDRFGKVGIYADDFYIIGGHDDILNFIPSIRAELANIGLSLHPDKVYFQPIRHGLTFCGWTVKDGRIYANKRTVNNCYMYLRHSEGDTDECFRQHINSFFGTIAQANSYGIRRSIGKCIPISRWPHIYFSRNFKTLKIRKNG